jgi:hypothetical protein
MRLVFCAFCWRSVAPVRGRLGRTKYFCNEHKAGSGTKNQHLRYKRRLLKEFQEKGISIDNNLDKSIYYAELSKSLPKLTISPTVALSNIQYKYLRLTDLKNAIINACSTYYPISYKKLSKIKNDDITDKFNLVNLITSSLLTSADEQKKPTFCVDLEVNKSSDLWVVNTMEMIARHEACMIVNEKKRRPGPRIGALKNFDLRNKIDKLLAAHSNDKKKVTQTFIAKKLGLTKQRVSILMNEPRYQKKV